MNLHIPVMVDEVLEFLITDPNGVYVDATLGGGGHSEKIIEKLSEKGKVIGIDWDKQAIRVAQEKLRKYQNRILLVNDTYTNLKKIFENLEISKVNGIFFDLGFSTLQLDDKERGFSFQVPSPLDMRMSEKLGLTAADLLNSSSEKELREIFFSYGEERWAKRIAQAVVKTREKNPFRTTTDLVNLVLRVIPRYGYPKKIHPATRIFQALRIAVNQELENLKVGLSQAVEVLSTGGRMVVISFHSLEDRVVKNFFRNEKNLKILTPKPIYPEEKEILSNPRARSAKLRAAEKNM